jgi:hypothetical protein
MAKVGHLKKRAKVAHAKAKQHVKSAAKQFRKAAKAKKQIRSKRG